MSREQGLWLGKKEENGFPQPPLETHLGALKFKHFEIFSFKTTEEQPGGSLCLEPRSLDKDILLGLTGI